MGEKKTELKINSNRINHICHLPTRRSSSAVPKIDNQTPAFPVFYLPHYVPRTSKCRIQLEFSVLDYCYHLADPSIGVNRRRKPSTDITLKTGIKNLPFLTVDWVWRTSGMRLLGNVERSTLSGLGIQHLADSQCSLLVCFWAHQEEFLPQPQLL